MTREVQLSVVTAKQQAFEPAPETAISSATSAVPVLWMALFEHGDIEVKRLSNGNRTLFALTSVETALARAASLRDVLPDRKAPIYGAAKALARELQEHDSDKLVTLYPAAIFAELAREQARRYLGQLSKLADLWAHARGGTPFVEVRRLLSSIGDEILTALEHSEARVARFYLLGTLADKVRGLEDYYVREGAGEADTEPEALAVGEQGLCLGRFHGVWKLLSSGCTEDLRGVWGEGDTAFLVGRKGSIVQLTAGEAQVMESLVQATLNAVWGFSAKSACAVGEAGTALAYNGEAWQPWPLPTQVALHRVWGTSVENLFVAGQESATYRFDGYGWGRLTLPTEGMVTGFAGDDVEVYAVAGTSHGGLLLQLGRDGWERSQHPRVDWPEGCWFGFEDELGLVAGTGVVALRREANWTVERAPLEQVYQVCGGAEVMVAGLIGEHGVIVSRKDEGWVIEAAVKGLQLFGVWVGGEPKPPRLAVEPDGASSVGAGG